MSKSIEAQMLQLLRKEWESVSPAEDLIEDYTFKHDFFCKDDTGELNLNKDSLMCQESIVKRPDSVSGKWVYHTAVPEGARKEYSEWLPLVYNKRAFMDTSEELPAISRDKLLEDIAKYSAAFGYNYFVRDNKSNNITRLYKSDSPNATYYNSPKPKWDKTDDENWKLYHWEFWSMDTEVEKFDESTLTFYKDKEPYAHYVQVPMSDKSAARGYYNVSNYSLMKFHNTLAQILSEAQQMRDFLRKEYDPETTLIDVLNEYFLEPGYMFCPHCYELQYVPDLRTENILCSECQKIIAEANADGVIGEYAHKAVQKDDNTDYYNLDPGAVYADESDTFDEDYDDDDDSEVVYEDFNEDFDVVDDYVE